MTTKIQTVKLNDYHKTTVLAKMDKRYGLVASSYTNYQQAYNALENVRALGIDAGIRDNGTTGRKYIVIIGE